MKAAWNDALRKKIQSAFGNKSSAILKKYEKAFLTSYTEEYPVEMAVTDINHIEALSTDTPLDTYFYYAKDPCQFPLHLRIFQWQEAIPLSDILPILENLGLRIYNERPHKLHLSQNQNVWISDYTVSSKSDFDIAKITDIFRDALRSISNGSAENDGFNKLILGASLTAREVSILRAYAKYLRQLGFRFTQAYIEKTLSDNLPITKDLIALFKARHSPKKIKDIDSAETLQTRINKALEAVTSLDEDRIFRRFMALILATVRTNYFQTGKDKLPKNYLAYKFSSKDIPEIPLPSPLYEIFVYSPRFEAIHLRAEKVARGGIRWSDRPEDFRTEVLGLMKAQKVKNSIIVPSGAKGGFALKTPADQIKDMKAEVNYCYRAFISGLLDITDNIKNNKIIHPDNVVCHDDDDPYLVVAADKGTATFSDTANAISAEYHFWLGDAFASGGSQGYDHKKIGITARGAWESVKRHFREFDIDVMNTDITVVGIGDMSGDVFGNGMIYSDHIQLIAAYDHRHIFIDPSPVPKTSFQERLRLFNLPSSSWESYNPKLISKGGGVFARSLKSIPINADMKRVLGITDNSLTPNELVRAILKAPVDLLFNGGIGTYVKASTESNMDVSDRSNDYCRINGKELRCKVACEGGNLGFTQLGRIEYALNKGLINTDFIDNSAGVDCSDHEVNLKILLDKEVHSGNITEKKRNSILIEQTREVADLVLQDNYHQALVLSFSIHSSTKYTALHQNFIKDLEMNGELNRELEFLPSEKTLSERNAAGLGLTRPELAVLLAYSKIQIKNEILHSDLIDDPFLNDVVETAFPKSLRKTYGKQMKQHRLHREIMATQLSNFIVNEMGITYIYRVQTETGVTVPEIIRAFAVATRIFNTYELQKSVQKLDFKISMQEQYEMLYNIRHLLNLATRWFLHSNYLKSNLKELVETFSLRISKLEGLMPSLMGGITRQYLQTLIERFTSLGLEAALAQRIGAYRAIYTSLNIIDIAMKFKLDLEKTARVYFAAGERFNLLWFRDQIASDTREGHWNILARLTLRDELDICQRAFTIAVMKNQKKELSEARLIDKWVDKNQRIIGRWDRLLAMLHNSLQIEYTMFFVAIRELLGLILNSE